MIEAFNPSQEEISDPEEDPGDILRTGIHIALRMSGHGNNTSLSFNFPVDGHPMALAFYAKANDCEYLGQYLQERMSDRWHEIRKFTSGSIVHVDVAPDQIAFTVDDIFCFSARIEDGQVIVGDADSPNEGLAEGKHFKNIIDDCAHLIPKLYNSYVFDIPDTLEACASPPRSKISKALARKPLSSLLSRGSKP